MRLFALVLTLLVPTETAVAVEPRAVMGRRVPRMAPPSSSDTTVAWRDGDVRTYVGSMLGVHAHVELDERQDVARLVLRGIPLGGMLTGEARFASDGKVVLSKSLSNALQRRMCAVTGVVEHSERLLVQMRLPIFGMRTMTLWPK